MSELVSVPYVLWHLVTDLLAGKADAATIEAAAHAPADLAERFDLVRMVAASTPAEVNEIARTTLGLLAMAEALGWEADND